MGGQEDPASSVSASASDSAGREGAEPASIFRTFLIGDIRGYTSFTRERGSAAAARLAKAFADLARDAVEARGGDVLEIRGDEVVAVFDDIPQAIRAAAELQQSCAEAMAEDPTLPLLAGIGIDSGEVVPVEDGFRGEALNLAARLCSRAAAGQVLVSETVQGSAKVADDLVLEDRGSASLKGFEHATRFWEALALPSGAAAGVLGEALALPGVLEFATETPLVGRDHEMRWARGTWRQVRRGFGRVLLVSGPSQVGKTRLAAELASFVDGSVRYAGAGGTALADAQSGVECAQAADTPTLVILDDADATGSELAEMVMHALGSIRDRPTMLMMLAQDPDASPALSALVQRIDARHDGHRRLSPLDQDGVHEIARAYLSDDVELAPLETFFRSSGGVPGHVHEVVSRWAREEATRRLSAAAEWLVAGRTRRATDLEFANNVLGMKLDQLYRVDEAAAGERLDVCPYKGLATFQPEDAGYFFGRERLVGELAARSVDVGLLGVVGASGSGKSSAVAAGLRPSLAAGLLPGSERWKQVSIRPGEHPIAELQAALGEGQYPLESALATISAETRLVLVIDQFEEAFTMCGDEAERDAFIRALTRSALDQPEALVVVPILRADFYGDCAAYPDFARLLADNHVPVGPMSKDELRRAIELPARRVGLRVESELIELLLAGVGEEPGGLPLVSTALVELWQERAAGWLRAEAYERTGGVDGAVARLAEGTYAELSAVEKETAPGVFLRLVGSGDGETATRRRVSIGEFDLDRSEASAAVIARFTQDRLLTRNDGTVEVAHEALIREWPRLQEWLAEDAQGREIRTHVAAAARIWADAGEEDSELYRGARLSATLDWAADHDRQLNDLERRFLTAGRQAGEREVERQRRANRRLRGLLVGVAIFLVVALVAGSLAVVQRGRARASATAADAQRLGAQALVDKHLDVSMLLAREGLALDDSIETRSNLLSVVAKWNPAIGVIDPGIGSLNAYGGMDVSADGRFLVATSSRLRSNAVLIDMKTRAVVRRLDTDPNFLANFGHSQTGHSDVVIVVPRGSSRIEGQDPITGTVDWTTTFDRNADGCCNINLSPDGTTLAIESHAEIILFHTENQTADSIPPPAGQIFADMKWTPDGDGLVGISTSRRRFTKNGYVGKLKFVTSWWDASGTKLRRRTTTMTDWGEDGVQNGDESQDGRWLWIAKFDNTVQVYGLLDGSHHVLQTADFPIWERVSPDGRTFAVASHDDTISIWRVRDWTLLETLSGHTGWPNAGMNFSRDSRTLYTGGQDGLILMWDLSGDHRLGKPLPAMIEGTWDLHNFFTISPNGRILAASRRPSGSQSEADSYVSLRYVKNQKLILKVPSFASSVAFSPDGKTFVTAGQREGLLIRSVTTGRPITRLNGSPRYLPYVPPGADPKTKFGNELRSVAFSPDGTILAAGFDDAKIYLWDVRSGSRPGQLRMPDRMSSSIDDVSGQILGRSVQDIVFSPDGTRLVAATGTSVVVWRLADRSRVVTLPINDSFGHVNAFAFSPDGRTLVSGEGDGTIHFWDTNTWKEIGGSVRAANQTVLSVAFDRTGTMLLTAGDDSSVRLFDVASRAEIGQPFPDIAGPPAFAAFTPDGQHIIAGNVAFHLYEWDVDPRDWAVHACEVAGRNLTPEEWNSYLPGRPYQAVCPSLVAQATGD